jgi:hypothetical protein
MAGEAFWFWARLFVQWMRMRLHHADRVHFHCALYIYKYKLDTFDSLMRVSLLIAIIVLAVIPSVVVAQGTLPVITSPTDGQILRGQFSITGTTDIPNFASAELDFAYASDSTGTWFLVQTFSQPVTNSAIAVWDTTSISDGDYILRLRVTLQDGSTQDATVKIRVQNETPISTATATITPTAIVPTITLTPIFTPQLVTPTPIMIAASSTPTSPPIFSTPTSLPPNPAEVEPGEINAGVQRGALVILGVFVVFGILIRLRRS